MLLNELFESPTRSLIYADNVSVNHCLLLEYTYPYPENSDLSSAVRAELSTKGARLQWLSRI
jgi:hypothetical protein